MVTHPATPSMRYEEGGNQRVNYQGICTVIMTQGGGIDFCGFWRPKFQSPHVTPRGGLYIDLRLR